jgi:SAM-dependent methyltransferase
MSTPPDAPRRCRLCGGAELATTLTLERMPVSHHLRTGTADPDPRFDLAFDSCDTCGLLQIVEPVPPELLYSDADTYTTGFHKPRHLDDLITTAVAHDDPGRAVDIGCNDGALMDALKRHGYGGVVGIEPNRTAAAVARDNGHAVHQDFLSPALAERLVAEHGPFDAAWLRHVAEHVDDLAGFFAAIRRLLRDRGLLVMELPLVEAGLARGNPAILWEEHVNYFVEPLAAHLLERYGFVILDRRHYAFGGGAIAFIARKEALPSPPPAPPGPHASLQLADQFKDGFARYRAGLREVIAAAQARGHAIAIYGAAPRSCVVAAACGIADSIDLVIDDRTEIQGRLMPGTRRPIAPLDAACNGLARPLLCLLGVGSENEFKVRAKMATRLRAPPLCVSLFPPRDTLASISAALAALARAGTDQTAGIAG